jgi:hypothetical protein
MPVEQTIIADEAERPVVDAECRGRSRHRRARLHARAASRRCTGAGEHRHRRHRLLADRLEHRERIAGGLLVRKQFIRFVRRLVARQRFVWRRRR